MTKSEPTPRVAFLSGSADKFRLGEYGGTVKLWVKSGVIVCGITKPKRAQETMGPNTAKNRKKAVEVAEALYARMPKGRGNTALPALLETEPPPPPPPLTVRDVWLSYIRSRMPDAPDECLDWAPAKLRTWTNELPKTVRDASFSLDYFCSVVRAARLLRESGLAPFDRDVGTIQPGEVQLYRIGRLSSGATQSTVATELGRLRNALAYVREQWPDDWGARADPTRKLRLTKLHTVPPAELLPEVGDQVLAHLAARPNAWRCFVAVALQLDTGRRIGAIGGRSANAGRDAKPLTASDYSEDEDGTGYIIWRAEAAKGGAYGQGDVRLPVTQRVRDTMRRAIQQYPNPLGPRYPLLWSPKDPTKCVSHSAINSALKAAVRAIGMDDTRVSTHSLVRSALTTIVDAEGSAPAAADYSGRTTDTVLRFYKRARDKQLRMTVEGLDSLNRARKEAQGAIESATETATADSEDTGNTEGTGT